MNYKDLVSKMLAESRDTIKRTPASHTIEAYGIKGMKRSPWRKSFKHAEHLNKWAEDNDAEVHGTRDLEQAKRGNLSPAIKESTENDSVEMDIPMLIRIMEYAKEDAKTDMDLHRIAEKLTTLSKQKGVLTMDDYKNAIKESKQNESIDMHESFTSGKTVYTSHTDNVLKGKIVKKDIDNKDHYIVQHKDGLHSVHQDNIHPQRKLAGYMHESESPLSFKSFLTELSTNLLGRYKKKAGEYATSADKLAASFNKVDTPQTKEFAKEITNKANQRFKGINKATKKQFDNDMKESEDNLAAYKKARATKEIGENKLDELSNDTLQNYENKSSKRIADKFNSGNKVGTSAALRGLGRVTRKLRGVGPGAVKKGVDEGVFDWKDNKSEIDWSNKKKKPEVSKEGGTIHRAREHERNAETGGNAAKKAVGRPAGTYNGSYNIDKEKRSDPEYKKQLSAKIMAAKKDNFVVRKEFKTSMNDALKKRQLELAAANK